MVFNEPFSPEKRDLPFTVLLQDSGDEYVDVGIRDYHNSLEVYDSLLEDCGFEIVRRENLKRHRDKESFAVLYEAIPQM